MQILTVSIILFSVKNSCWFLVICVLMKVFVYFYTQVLNINLHFIKPIVISLSYGLKSKEQQEECYV